MNALRPFLLSVLLIFTGCGKDFSTITIYPDQKKINKSLPAVGPCAQTKLIAGLWDSNTKTIFSPVRVNMVTDFSSINAGTITTESSLLPLLQNPANTHWNPIRIFVPTNTSANIRMFGEISLGDIDTDGTCKEYTTTPDFAYVSAFGAMDIPNVNGDMNVSLPLVIVRKEASTHIDGGQILEDSTTHLKTEASRKSFVLATLSPRLQDTLGLNFTSSTLAGVANGIKDVAISGTNIAVATWSGVAVSVNNGITYTLLTNAIAPFLCSNTVNKVLWSGTRLYAATSNGICYSDYAGTFSNFTIVPTTSALNITSMALNGPRLAAASTNTVLFTNAAPGTMGLNNTGSQVNGVAVDSSGYVYIATNNGIQVSTAIDNISSFGAAITTGLASIVVNDISINPLDQIFASTQAGVSISRQKTFGINFTAHTSGLTSMNIKKVFFDPVISNLSYVLSNTDLGLLEDPSSDGTGSPIVKMQDMPTGIYMSASISYTSNRKLIIAQDSVLQSSQTPILPNYFRAYLSPESPESIVLNLKDTPTYQSYLPTPPPTLALNNTASGYSLPKMFPIVFTYNNYLGKTCTAVVNNPTGSNVLPLAIPQTGKSNIDTFVVKKSSWVCN